MKTTPGKTDLLTTLAESFLEQLRRGESPSIEDYAARHPELATEIRELFATLRLVDELGEQPQFGGNQPSTAAVTIPSRLGDFQLTREIARGGMGIVYEALQSSLGRRVAVKVLPPTEVADISRRLRFQREARAAANLHHTNIVPVFEVGEQDGICFYAMQFIEGETLAEVWRELRRMKSTEPAGSTGVAEGDPTLAHSICQVLHTSPEARDAAGGQGADSAPAPIAALDTRHRPATHVALRYSGPSGLQTTVTSRGDPRSSASHWKLRSGPSQRQYFDNVAGIVLQMVDALAYAHSQGVLHRDIKPSNVILDTHCRAWLTDFGLAKVAGDDLTADSHLVGTLRYMSPERFAGQVDARSDVYSAGLILYELITLRPAFDALDHAGMMHVIQHARPIPPRECEAAVPKDLETIVLCAMDKDPAKRYQSAAALVTDLSRYLEGRPLLARRASRWEHTWRWCRRNPVVSSLSAALCCVVLGAWITTFCLWRRAESSHAQAEANLALSQSNLELAVDAVDQFGAKVSEDLRLKQQDLRPLRRDLLQTAVDFQQKLLDRRGNSDLARIDLARSYHRLAKLTAEIEAHNRAVSLYQRAIGQYESLMMEDPNNNAIQYELSLNLGELAHLWIDTGHSAEAEAALDRGITMLTPLLKLAPDPSSVRSQLALQLGLKAYVLSMTRRFEESQDIWHQAIAHQEELRSSHPDKVAYMTNLAHAHAKMAETLLGGGIVNWREAKAELHTALTLQRDAVTHADASDGDWLILAAVLRDLANIEKISGDAAAGATRFQEAIEVLERLMREQPSVLTNIEGAASCYFQLGTCYAVANQPDESANAFRKSVSLWERLVTQMPGNALWESHYARALQRTGSLALDDGDLETALSAYDRAVKLLDGILAREPESFNAHTFLPDVLVDRGRLLARLERYDDALADCTRAVELAADDTRDAQRLERAWVLVCAADHRQAVSEARDALQELIERCNPKFLRDSFLLAARVCGQAAANVHGDPALPENEREKLFQRYASDLLAVLRESIEADFDFSAEVRQMPEFAALRAEPEFVRLLDHETAR